ncbi:hypothetical protein V1522DRAFT_391919 [Lipomyces starkeyi]
MCKRTIVFEIYLTTQFLFSGLRTRLQRPPNISSDSKNVAMHRSYESFTSVIYSPTVAEFIVIVVWAGRMMEFLTGHFEQASKPDEICNDIDRLYRLSTSAHVMIGTKSISASPKEEC